MNQQLVYRYTLSLSKNENMFKEKNKTIQNKTKRSKQKEKRKSPPGKLNNRVLPRRNLEPIGAVGTNLWPFSFDGSVGLLHLSPQP